MQRIRRGGSFSASAGAWLTAELQNASRDESICQFDGFRGVVSTAVRRAMRPARHSTKNGQALGRDLDTMFAKEGGWISRHG